MLIKDVAPLLADLALVAAHTRTLAPLLWGDRGLGKSEVVYEAGERAKLPVVELRIGQMEPGDFLGMPTVVEGQTAYARPDWWPTERSILFLDEPNRSHRDTRNAVFQLVLDHRIGKHRLPAGCLIVGAANPPTADYGDVEATEDAAFLSRWIHLSTTADADGWLDYEGKHTGADWLAGAVARFPDLLGASSSYLPELAPNPRALSVARRLLAHLPARHHLVVLQGLVGPVAAANLLQARDALEQPIAWSDVLARNPSTLDHARIYGELGRVDLLRPAMSNGIAALKAAKTDNEAQAIGDAFLAFAKLMPADLQVQALKAFSVAVAGSPAALKAFARDQSRWKSATDELRNGIRDIAGIEGAAQ